MTRVLWGRGGFCRRGRQLSLEAARQAQGSKHDGALRTAVFAFSPAMRTAPAATEPAMVSTCSSRGGNQSRCQLLVTGGDLAWWS